MRILGYFLLSCLLWRQAALAALEPPSLPDEVIEEVVRVCGSCHFTDYFDQQTYAFLLPLFIQDREEILFRLTLPLDDDRRMPKYKAPFDPEMRRQLIEYLRSLDAASG